MTEIMPVVYERDGREPASGVFLSLLEGKGIRVEREAMESRIRSMIKDVIQ